MSERDGVFSMCRGALEAQDTRQKRVSEGAGGAGQDSRVSTRLRTFSGYAMSGLLRGKLWFSFILVAVAGLVLNGCGSDSKQEVYNNEITIESLPESGAKVLINDDDYGVTPVTVKNIAPGAVLVELSKDRYKPTYKTIRVPEQGSETFSLEMRLLVGYLTLDSDPSQAEVKMDGDRVLGGTPLRKAEVPVGVHRFELRKERYEPLEFELEVKEEYQYTKAFDLTPKKGLLEVYSSPTGASIWLNNQIQVQKTPTRFELTPGTYTVSVYAPGYVTAEEVTTLGPEERKNVDLKMIEGDAPPGMVLIPAGEAIIGVDNQSPDERPRRKLFVEAFYIDKYEVTNAEFKMVFSSHRFDKGKENYPVSGVTWSQATAYASAVKKRLPTEIEWEKAARGTDGREYPWGNLFDASLANTNATTPSKIQEVGQYRGGASPYGCLDMAGNVCEWTESWYAAYPGNTLIEKEYGQLYRTLRGGSFMGSSFDARSARRRFDLPDRARADYGFRCVADVQKRSGVEVKASSNGGQN
ncbi:MAG: SUMF1/EgtB/PvdO family nonheme iron enzyme [Candidatus Hydrogenedentes bacterium]|nr:SUMF1/EgtB/PvdO family nonheme iron enzyme [Candidatus Hydrogenedentota bacterium]